MIQARDNGRVNELDPERRRWEDRFGRIPRFLAVLVLVLGSAVLLGWQFDIVLFPNVSLMKRSNAAAGFILAALGLWLQGRPDGRLSHRGLTLSRVASVFLSLLGGLTLLEYLLHLDLSIDLLLVREPAQTVPLPGRMSPHEAICFLSLGLGSLFFSVPCWGRKLAMVLYAPVGAISFLGFVGYLQGATFLYQVQSYPPMSWLSALGFLAIVMGHFLCRSPSPRVPTVASAGPAGMMTRRLVLAAITVPVLLSWISGFAVRRGYVSPEVGLALFVSVLVWTLALFAFKTARLLETSELQYKTLFERTGLGMAELDVKTKRFLSANQKFQEITGYKLEELRELSPFDLDHPDDLMNDHETFARMLRGETPTYRTEKRYIRKDGATIWVRVDAAIARRNDRGEPLTTVGSVSDITDEKELSLALEQSEKSLRSAVQVRDQFNSIASHELKTPLTNLLLRAQLARRGILSDSGAGGRSESLPDFLGHVEAQVVRLNQLVDEMLDVARIRTGKLSLTRERFDLNDAVKAVIERLLPLLLDSTGGKPPIFESSEPVFGTWDRARIEQVLTNLLSNVIRYGRGVPAIIRVVPSRGSVHLIVQDHGIGIAPENLEKIFGRFFAGTTSAKQGGLGLGLYLTRKILEAHGGSICANSQVGVGTTFIVDLPLEQKGVDVIEVA